MDLQSSPDVQSPPASMEPAAAQPDLGVLETRPAGETASMEGPGLAPEDVPETPSTPPGRVAPHAEGLLALDAADEPPANTSPAPQPVKETASEAAPLAAQPGEAAGLPLVPDLCLAEIQTPRPDEIASALGAGSATIVGGSGITTRLPALGSPE